MSKTSVFSCAANVNGDGICGDNWIPPQSPATNPNAPQGVPVVVQLSAGSNTIAVPSGSLYALVSAQPTSTNAKTLRTVNGDTGVAFTVQMALLPVAGLSSLYITSTSSDVVTIGWL